MASSHPASSSWLHGWRSKPQAQLRLFCFPFAGGGASLYCDLRAQAPAEIEICPLQLPGRENRLHESAYASLEPLAAALLDILLPALDLPYAFFGHSMGALISFELTRALRRGGTFPAPIHLFVSGHRSPQLPDPKAPIHHLSDAHLMEALRHLSGTLEEVLQHAESMSLLLPLLRADFRLCETYHYKDEPPLHLPISAFGGLADPDVPKASILAWREQTRATFVPRFFPGDHFFLLKNQHIWQDALLHDLLLHLHQFNVGAV
jgi:medium-chain acyl-[acyl-carrier-protein] hydrolase